MSVMIQAEIPEQLAAQAQQLVEQGGALSMQAIINESLRRYLQTHSQALTEQLILEDVKWGLHGDHCASDSAS